jgi:hypothetical protein
MTSEGAAVWALRMRIEEAETAIMPTSSTMLELIRTGFQPCTGTRAWWHYAYLYVGFCVEGVKHLAQGVKHPDLPYPRIISKIEQGKKNQRKRGLVMRYRVTIS